MTHEPTPLAHVEAHPTGSRWTLVFVRDLQHPPTKVWKALTRPDHLSQWAPYTANRDLGTSGATVLTMIDGETHEDIRAEVTHAEPVKLLDYSWGADLLRWELEETPSGTRLTLSHTVQDKDFVPKVAAGWHLCLDVAEKLLDGHPIAPIRGNEAMNRGWTELNAQYAAQLDIPVSD